MKLKENNETCSLQKICCKQKTIKYDMKIDYTGEKCFCHITDIN